MRIESDGDIYDGESFFEGICRIQREISELAASFKDGLPEDAEETERSLCKSETPVEFSESGAFYYAVLTTEQIIALVGKKSQKITKKSGKHRK